MKHTHVDWLLSCMRLGGLLKTLINKSSQGGLLANQKLSRNWIAVFFHGDIPIILSLLKYPISQFYSIPIVSPLYPHLGVSPISTDEMGRVIQVPTLLGLAMPNARASRVHGQTTSWSSTMHTSKTCSIRIGAWRPSLDSRFCFFPPSSPLYIYMV